MFHSISLSLFIPLFFQLFAAFHSLFLFFSLSISFVLSPLTFPFCLLSFPSFLLSFLCPWPLLFRFSSFHSLFSLPLHPSLHLSLFPPLSYTLSHMQVKDAPVFRQTVLCEFCSSWPRRWRNSRKGFFRQSSREWPFVLQSWQNEFRLLGRWGWVGWRCDARCCCWEDGRRLGWCVAWSVSWLNRCVTWAALP